MTEMTMQPNHKMLSIRTRLFLGFGAISFIFLLAIGISLYIIYHTKQTTNEAITTHLPVYNISTTLDNVILSTQLSLQNYLLKNDLTEKTAILSYSALISSQAAALDHFFEAPGNEKLLTQWQEVKKSINSYLQNLTAIINSSDLNKANQELNFKQANADANVILDYLQGQKQANGVRSNGLDDILHTKLVASSKQIVSDMKAAETTQYILSMLGILAAIVVTFLTTRSITRHINLYRQHSNRIASGDLRQLLTIQSQDEIGQLGDDLNQMTDSLSSITKQITEACHNMVASLEEVRQAVDTQTSGATEQASSINEITASLEEIEKSSDQTMEKAKALGDVAEKTRERGQQGLEAVEQSIVGMKSVRDKVQMIAQTILDLSNQTQQVGEITGVVTNLAQQSKMLALNASIEAAKAGDAGKGFAVVAAEVKNLAEQSEQSTTQVQKILEDIRHATEKAVMVTEEGTKGVDEGTNLVVQTGDIVRSLTDVIHEATLASEQIEAAIRQEGVGIEQISAGMNEINQVTASFVSSAKQTMEAINNLSVIAHSLKERMEVYKI